MKKEATILIKLQLFFRENKDKILILMTVLLLLSIFGKVLNNTLLYNTSLVLLSIIGGLPIVFRGISALSYRIISIEFLIMIAIIGALFIGEYKEAGVVVWLFSIGDILQEKTLNKTRSSIKKMVEGAPRTALKVKNRHDREYKEINIDNIEVGNFLLVKAGGNIPVDGHVVAGSGNVNESTITGESLPQVKSENMHVYAGTHLVSGSIVVIAEQVGNDTTFGRLIELVEEAQDAKTNVQNFIDRFSQYYTPSILLIGILVFFMTNNLNLAITILVLGCPGALIIGVPVSTVAGIGRAASTGILTKGPEALEQLSKVDTLIFDKTGTITVGDPKITQLNNILGDKDENMKILASVERESSHPLASAILKTYRESYGWYDVSISTTIQGKGISANVNNSHVLIGNETLMRDNNVDLSQLKVKANRTIILMAVNNKLHLYIEISDPIRSDVRNIFEELKRIRDYNFVLLSGDSQAVSESTVGDLPFNEIHGDLLPEDKLLFVEKLQSDGHKIAFIGDGINDSLALTGADIGIAVGNGTDIALEVSDIVLLKADISQLPGAIRIAKKTTANMRENISIALFTVGGLFVALLLSQMHMGLGMLIHETSILVVIFNSLRLVPLKKG